MVSPTNRAKKKQLSNKRVIRKLFKAVKRDEPLEAKGVDMQGLEEILPNEAAEPVKRKRRRRKRQAGYARPKKHYPEPTNDQIKDLSERQEKLMKKIYHTGGVAPGPPVRVAINGQHEALTQVVTAVPCSQVADKVRFIFR